ncbi:zinc finger protein ubi-d4 B isoform X1 [Hydra vulgaris]|uniref:Zinc finger protein ubi-d4 B isoform X1 n=1 Tax=Hydra vulgaris TaxID=6087 RepID=A0ABM4CGX5_HYDVU
MNFIGSNELPYKEAMDQVHAYNSKLLLERRLRMPYIDSQTGLAQQDCHLWVSRVQRCAPLREGQVYSYPSRRWRVRRRPDFTGSSKPMEKPKPIESIEHHDFEKIFGDDSNSFSREAFHVPSTPVSTLNLSNIDQEYYGDEAFDSEFDSDDEFVRKKKRKNKLKESFLFYDNKKGKKNALAMKLAEKVPILTKDEISRLVGEERKRPYGCQICSKRYKNQQGLRYHYEHFNHEVEDFNTNDTVIETIVDQPPNDHVSGAKRQKGMPPSLYCDFCLGNIDENKKSGSSEELISCSDCGRSGHPSCLQFDDNLATQVKKYKWQCIECKCCCLCGTSDNDDQLLFCDDCDRGYHMYCLVPAISEPPEGSWQCQLCEARVKGDDVRKVAVLPEHMDSR